MTETEHNMAISDSRRLNMVLPYLYPNLINQGNTEGDYHLQNDMDGRGIQLHWHNVEITEPTTQQLADAKEAAVDAYWWKLLRGARDRLLETSDWSQGADVPSDLKASYATYRTDLRDLPTTVTKPDFATLNGQETSEWNIDALMPSKP